MHLQNLENAALLDHSTLPSKPRMEDINLNVNAARALASNMGVGIRFTREILLQYHSWSKQLELCTRNVIEFQEMNVNSSATMTEDKKQPGGMARRVEQNVMTHREDSPDTPTALMA